MRVESAGRFANYMTCRKNLFTVVIVVIAVVAAIVVIIFATIMLNAVVCIILCYAHNFQYTLTVVELNLMNIATCYLRPVVVSQLVWYLARNKAVGLQLLTYITAEELRKSDDRATLCLA